ncbi:ADP-ribosylglycohydrolase family protein [Desulfonema limicola]|uniref:ADP-ribosylglycohydrolase family protein n=2 Tax=Desulfonema limicola TaxID=45656 RepID=A0A975B8Q1_9BACT|nr:ADP-ribosylglycohydrolase family protein [Desulfonema limicola]
MDIFRDKFRGIILGTAVGDALGLPAEGLSRKRVEKFFKGRWHHRLIFNKGMVSDDTEHTVFTAQCLIAHPDSPEKFIRKLAWSLRWWILFLPAGAGWATLRAVIRLWAGFSPEKSGVYSAGNGPAMRSAVLGAFFARDINNRNFEKPDAFIRASTMITHTDPRALTGAKAVAYITALGFQRDLIQKPELKEFIDLIRFPGKTDPEWIQITDSMSRCLQKDISVKEFAEIMGLSKGITGYIYHSVPAAIYAWYLHYGDFETTLSTILNCGGDTDTAGAIAGAVAGSVTGEKGIPQDWIKGIWEWPISINVLKKLSDALYFKAYGLEKKSDISFFGPGTILRNLFFIIIILMHGFRRLFPPY